MKLHIGDEVLVTAGKDKGRRGHIEHVFPKKDRVAVPGVNVYKRHRKSFGGEKGGIIEFSRPLPASNVAFFCNFCQQGTRIAYQKTKTGEKTRICVKCKKEIDLGKSKIKT